MSTVPPPPAITVRDVAGPADLDAALALRLRVFCDEQGVPREEEVDEHDATARHLVAVDPDGRVVATARILDRGDLVHVGRVAVERDLRGAGVGSLLMVAAREHAEARDARGLRLSAQVRSTGVYLRAGYRIVSDEPYDDAGIPHVAMELDLR